MTSDIIKDLTAKKGPAVFDLLKEFNRNASWGGYFYTGVDAEALAQVGHYEKTPRHGLHITAWHSHYTKLNPSDFLKLVTEQRTYDAQVLAYADDAKNQAIAVARPPIYMTPATPHITISWVAGGNPAASGYMQFSDPIPNGIPAVMHCGSIKIIMHNNREMNLGIFRSAIQSLEQDRMTEIASKLDAQIKQVIDQNYDMMPYEQLRTKFPSDIKYDENLTRLYTQYRCDITTDNVPSLDELTNNAVYNQEECATLS